MMNHPDDFDEKILSRILANPNDRDYIEHILDKLLEGKVYKDTIKHIVQLGFIYRTQFFAPEQPISDHDLTSKIGLYLTDESIQYSPDCKSPFLYRLHFFLTEKKNAEAQQIVDELFMRGIEFEDGTILWKYATQDGTEYVNWGLSHGIAGIAALLAQGIETGALNLSLNKHLLEKLGYVLVSQGIMQQRMSDFEGGVVDCFMIYGYCYGVLPTALSLYRIAVFTGNAEWKEYARQVIERLAEYRPDNSSFQHHFLCHGFAGVALAFFVAYKRIGNPEFLTASEAWAEISHTELASNREGLANALQNRLDHSLLFGLPGIELAIQTISFDKSIWWTPMLGY
jgi:hypothetical protein